jgi:hypothetical protein
VSAGPGKDSLIFDTGPLETFAFADEPAWSALWSGFGSRMHRTDAVVDEIARKIRRYETFLEKVTIALWPGAPIDLSDDESQHMIDTLRERLRREGDSPTQHVGEAATILAARRCGGIAVIDDFDGASLARYVLELAEVDLLDQAGLAVHPASRREAPRATPAARSAASTGR